MYEHVEARIFASIRVDENGCWRWQGKKDTHGYGALRMPGLPAPTQLAHRTSYHVFVGPIPAGLQIDHLCRVRDCVNPAHMEPVTPRENTRRSPITAAARHTQQTHCKRGHEFTPDNTYRNRKGHRFCRECRRAWCRQDRLKRLQRAQQSA